MGKVVMVLFEGKERAGTDVGLSATSSLATHLLG